MTGIRKLKQKLAQVNRLWEEKKFDRAFAAVEQLMRESPGNARLHIRWARLLQLQEETTHDLAEAALLKQCRSLDSAGQTGTHPYGPED